MEDNSPTQSNTDEPNPFINDETKKNPFLKEENNIDNPLMRNESKGPETARKFARPEPKKEEPAGKPSFFRGRREVTKREILWKISQPDAYKNMWGGKSRMYQEKMKELAEKHFSKGQYEHYTKAELDKITRAISKEVNKEEGSWKTARNDMLNRIKDITN